MKQIRSISIPVRVTTRDEYVVMQSGSEVPKVELNKDKDGYSKGILKSMIEDTENYRIEKVLRMMYGGYDEKVRKRSLDYMLRVWDKLSPDQCEEVINQANRMISGVGIDDEIRVGVAIALRTFVGTKDVKKKEVSKSYEQVLTENGEVEIDDEDFITQ